MVHLHYVLLSRAISLLAIRAIACYTLNKQDFTYLTFYKTLFIGKKIIIIFQIFHPSSGISMIFSTYLLQDWK